MRPRTISHWLYLALVIILIACAFFLRIYRIPEYLTFLSDQGRDAIILKRLVTLEKLVFVGPTTSIGSVFTGPFFYYLVAPSMALWWLHPVGPAYGIAIINTIGLILSFLFIYKHFGRVTALIFLVLIAFSASQVMQSRFSWNPNPVSVFSFLTLAAFYYATTTRQVKWYVITGVMIGLDLQLHYITILLLLPIGIHLLLDLISAIRTDRSAVSHHLLAVSCAISAAILTFTPLILFEIKNKFINFYTLLKATSTGEIQAKNILYTDRLYDVARALWKNAFGLELGTIWSIITICMLVIMGIVIAHRSYAGGHRRLIYWCVIVVGSFIPLFALLETGRHVHYYNHLYLAFYFLSSLIISEIITAVEVMTMKKEVARDTSPPRTLYAIRYTLYAVLAAALLWCSYTSLATFNFLTDPPHRYTQISDAQEVARHIISQLSSDTYQVVGLPYYETDGHYRYYLEYFGKRPMPMDTLGDPRELYVICHGSEQQNKDCGIPGNAQWQIADFQNRYPTWTIKSVQKVTSVQVYKLIP